MPGIIVIGSILVTMALISYSIGIITEQIKHLINIKILSFITLGLLFDITATSCMIIGSTNSPFTLHGLIGYIGLLVMIIETILAWRFYRMNNHTVLVKRSLHLYSRIAYIIWISVYITGILLVTLK